MSLKCQAHQQKTLVGFCVNKQCKQPRSCCLKCLLEFHLDHPKELIELDDYNIWIKSAADSLPKIMNQIKDIEYVIQIIKLSFENFSKCFALNNLTTKNLDHIITAVLSMDQQNQYFIQVIRSLHDFSKGIFNIEIDKNNNQYMNNQGEQLIKSKKWDESLQYLTNLYAQQNNDLEKQLATSLQTIKTTFSCFGFNDFNDQYYFSKQMTSKNIILSNNDTTAIKIQENQYAFAIALPSVSFLKSQIKLKFKIVDFKAWIALGICTKDATNKVPSFDEISKQGHGYCQKPYSSFYMISTNGTVYSWSHNDQSLNYKPVNNFGMKKDDIIQMTIDTTNGQLSWFNLTSNSNFVTILIYEDHGIYCHSRHAYMHLATYSRGQYAINKLMKQLIQN